MDFLKAVLRNSMLGLCSAIARVGGIVSPWVAVYLPAQVSTLDSVESATSWILFPGREVRWSVTLHLWGFLRRGRAPCCTLSHRVPWITSPWHLRGFRQTHSYLHLRYIPFQDLERMKANAKSTWECVWPSRKGREAGQGGEDWWRLMKMPPGPPFFAIQAGFDDKRA